jgi:hypothetical protein
MRALRVALVTLLALPAPAAAATWSPPQPLSGAHTFVDPAALAVSADGRALAAWSFQDGLGNRGLVGAASASRRPGGTAFDSQRALLRRGPLDRRPLEGVAAYARGRAIAVSTSEAGSPPLQPRRLEVRFGRTTGRFERPVTIRRLRGAGRIADVALSVNARGDMAVAWFEDRGVRTDRVYVALRRSGAPFGPPQRLGTGRIRSVSAAVGDGGDVLVAWDARGTLRARFRPRGRRDFRATQTIRSEDAFSAELHPVVTPNGRAVLAWSAQFLSEGGSSGPVFFQAAVQPAGAERFRRAALLERLPATEGEGRPIDAVADSTGVVAIAWSGFDGTTQRVRAARVGADGSVGPAADVSPPGASALLTDLSAGPGGRLIAVWEGVLADREAPVTAAIAPRAGAPFGPPEAVSPTGRGDHGGHAAFDPATGRPTVIFAGRPAASGPPPGAASATVQAATRSE